MKKNIPGKITIFCCVATCFLQANAITHEATFAGGTGTPDDPYLIETAAQFDAMRNARDKSFQLISDIDFTGYPKGDGKWWPVGEWGSGDGSDQRFSGVFDGNGYSLKNLVAEREDHDLSFFGVTDGATIKNVLIENCDIRGNGRLGILTGNTRNTTIEQVGVIHSKCINATGNEAGGITGPLMGNSKIRNCYVVNTEISAAQNRVGGISSMIEDGGEISHCYVSATISGSNEVGGIAGYVSGNPGGNISNCVVIGGSITATHEHRGRITGTKHTEGASFTNNYASEEFEINGSVIVSDQEDSKEGKSVPVSDLQTIEFYEQFPLFNITGEEAIWIIDDAISSYPVFTWQKDEGPGTGYLPVKENAPSLHAGTDGISIEGITTGDIILIYNINGKNTQTLIAFSERIHLYLQEEGIHIITIRTTENTYSYKVKGKK